MSHFNDADPMQKTLADFFVLGMLLLMLHVETLIRRLIIIVLGMIKTWVFPLMTLGSTFQLMDCINLVPHMILLACQTQIVYHVMDKKAIVSTVVLQRCKVTANLCKTKSILPS